MKETQPITIAVGGAELEAMREAAIELYGNARWIGKVARAAVRHHLQLRRQTTLDELLAGPTRTPAQLVAPPIPPPAPRASALQHVDAAELGRVIAAVLRRAGVGHRNEIASGVNAAALAADLEIGEFGALELVRDVQQLYALTPFLPALELCDARAHVPTACQETDEGRCRWCRRPMVGGA